MDSDVTASARGGGGARARAGQRKNWAQCDAFECACRSAIVPNRLATHALTWIFKQRSKALPLRLSRCKTHTNTVGRPRCARRERPIREIEMASGGACDHSQSTDQACRDRGVKQADGASLTPQEDGTEMAQQQEGTPVVQADDYRAAHSEERPRAPSNSPAGPCVPVAEEDRPVASRTL